MNESKLRKIITSCTVAATILAVFLLGVAENRVQSVEQRNANKEGESNEKNHF